jgi:hypothetical protein
MRIVVVVLALVAMALAWPNLNRPVVRTSDGEEHVAGQLIIQLRQSQREFVRLSSQDGVALFGIPALDNLSRKWQVEDVTRLMGNPRPSETDKRHGCDLQFVIQFGEKQDVTPVAADYRALSEVDVVCPNAVMHMDEDPNDPRFTSQWHYQNLKAAVAWGIAKGDTTVVNVPLDDGVDFLHPDVVANLWINHPEDINGNGTFDSTPAAMGGDMDGIDQDGDGYADDVIGYDFVAGDAVPFPNGTDTHGQHCWGISNAVTNNSEGVAGTTWNSRSMGIRCGQGGSVYLSAAISGIYYGIMKGIWSVSMSFGGNSPYPPMATACQDAWDNGMVLFGSAGNDGARAVRYPACYDGVENVAASGRPDKKTSWSNWGPWVDVTAPGEGILSTVTRLNGSYGSMDGTSMSCPLAAGVACWIKSFRPSLTNQEVVDLLHASCDTMPDSLFRIGELGAGRVSMGNVVLPVYYCDLQMESWRFNDASGNGNGRPDPGETVALIVTYANTAGWQNATNVWAVLRPDSADLNWVQVIKDTARFPDIPAGSSGNCSADSFLVTVPAATPPQFLKFHLEVHATPDAAYPTSMFSVQAGDPRVLIVDDDEGSDYEKYYTGACDSNGVLYDVYTVQTSGSPSSDTLRHYPVVFWFTGNDSVNTLTSTDQTNLATYLNGGGSLLIAGQNIAQDLQSDGFLEEYLHAQFVEDSTGKTFVCGYTGDPISGAAGRPDTMVLGGASGANNARSCDGVRPTGDATGSGHYKDFGDTTVQAVVHYSGAYHVVYFACPFEAINHSVSRYLQKWTLVARILRFFGETVPGVEQEMPSPDLKPYVLRISPSPFAKRALVEFTAPVSGAMELRMYTAAGRLVSSQTGAARLGQRMAFTLDGSTLSNGVYLIQLVTPVGLYAQKTAVLK